MQLAPGEVVAKSGSFLYDGTVRCPLRIVRAPFRPGTGDHEDEPEVRDDVPGTWYRIDLTAAGEPDRFSSSIVGFAVLEDAVAQVQRIAASVEWDE